MAGAYLVTLDRSKCGHSSLRNDADAMVVYATDATQAKQICSAKYDGDCPAWSSSDATATLIAAAADWNGWTFKIDITGGATAISVTKVADATDNTIDEIGAALVVLLNATAINGAAYNSTTQVLTIAETTDVLGDKTVVMTVTPPGGSGNVASTYSSLVHQGASSAALAVTLSADAAVVPVVIDVLKQVS